MTREGRTTGTSAKGTDRDQGSVLIRQDDWKVIAFQIICLGAET